MVQTMEHMLDSERKQRFQKKSLVGENPESQFVHMEHHEKRGKKNMTVMKETLYAYRVGLKRKLFQVTNIFSHDFLNCVGM